MSKSPEAFRTISEVAEGLDIPQHVLRFWETRFSQIKPLKRGGGRRYYRPGDVDLLSGIRKLLYGEGYTIRGVQRILRDRGIAHVIAIGRDEVGVEPEPSPEPEAKVPAKPAEAAPAPSAGMIATTAPAIAGLSRGDIEELRLALTDLAAARRILERTE